MIRTHVLICGGTGCTSSGSAKIREAMETELAAAGLADEVKIVLTGCFGLCANGPIVIVYPEGTFYSRVAVEDVKEIVNEHFLKGRVVSRLVHKEAADDGQIKDTVLPPLKFVVLIEPANVTFCASLKLYPALVSLA